MFIDGISFLTLFICAFSLFLLMSLSGIRGVLQTLLAPPRDILFDIIRSVKKGWKME